MTPRRASSVAFGYLVLSVCWAVAIAAAASGCCAALDNTAVTPQRFPSDGYLSHDRYTNAFFGFWLEFPPDAYLKPIPMPLPPPDREDLLEVLGPAPPHAQISISAFRSSDQEPPNAKVLLRKLLDQELSVGVEELKSLSKTSIAGRHFYTFETRRGIDQHAIYATEMDGYVVRFILSARDPKVVQELQKTLSNLQFVAPATAKQYAGLGAATYEGPSIPLHLVQAIQADPPAKKVDAGRVTQGVYENRQLGLAYVIPKDWTVAEDGIVQPAVERWQMRNAPASEMGTSERNLLHSCERVLFSAWKIKPKAGQDLLYDDFGEVTVSAMSLSCFPSLHFPSELDERNPIRDFLISYGLTHPIMRDMKGARAFEAEGRVFIVSQGTVAYQTQGEALSRRVSVATALTQQRGYLLTFFFAAPHDAELRELMNVKAIFEPDVTANKPKAEKAASTAPSDEKDEGTVLPTRASAGGTPTTTLPDNSAGAGSGKGVQSDPDAQQPADGASSGGAHGGTNGPPSLLKPGETMQDQQMKGASLPKK